VYALKSAITTIYRNKRRYIPYGMFYAVLFSAISSTIAISTRMNLALRNMTYLHDAQLEYRLRLPTSFPNFDSIMMRLFYTRQVAVAYMILFILFVVFVSIFGTLSLIKARKHDTAEGWRLRRFTLENLIFVCGICAVVFIPAQFVALPFIRHAFAQLHDLLSMDALEAITRWNVGLLMQNALWVFASALVIVMLSTIVAAVRTKIVQEK